MGFGVGGVLVRGGGASPPLTIIPKISSSAPPPDERFPPDAAVEFVFSSSPDKVEGKGGATPQPHNP